MRNVFWMMIAGSWALGAVASDFPRFTEHVINGEAGTGLAITVADVNGNGKLDIVGVSATDVAWYENPTWERHLMTDTIRGSNVCIDPHDVDGDGIPEFALGADWQFNNTASGGALYLLKANGDVREPWRVITLVDEEPTLHRARWADVTGDGQPVLVVAPLKGIGTSGPDFQERGARLYTLRPPANPLDTPWEEEQIDESLHVLHNIWPIPAEGGREAILAASFEGVTRFDRTDGGVWEKRALVAGNPAPLPDSGAGEIKQSAAGPVMMATIEPWHGHQAVIYSHDEDGGWRRHVIDDTLAGGHAIWWADFDGDGEDELLVGFRDKAGPEGLPGLNVYDPHFENGGLRVVKHVIDDGGMATEDALAADMNGDGWPDIVAFGRATRNIKYYENMGRQR